MPDQPLLLIYVGEDFLFPTVFNAEGAACSMNGESSRHLWLYFDATGQDVSYSYRYKIKVANKIPGYYGRFLEGCAQKEKVTIDVSTCGYSSLLKYSGLTDDLRKLYVKYSHQEDAVIQTAYVFVESIPDDQRKALIDAMSDYGFVPVAFSVLLSELVMRYVSRDNARLNPTLGDKALILNAVNDKLVLTDAVFDGDRWISDGTCSTVSHFGDTPIKDALVRYVISYVDQYNGHLFNNGLLEEEFEYQRANADQWMASPRMGDGSIFIPNFRYKHFGEQSFSCSVSDRALSAKTEDLLRTVISGITSYMRSRVGDGQVRLVMLGAAFDDKELVDKIISGLGSPHYQVITTSNLPLVFECYQDGFGTVRDAFKDFDRRMHSLAKQRAAVTAWGKMAGFIRDIRIRIREAADGLAEKVSEDTRQFEHMSELCLSYLTQNDFDKAEQVRANCQIPRDVTNVAIQQAVSLSEEVRRKRPEFEAVTDLPGASQAIGDINAQSEQIGKLIRQSDELGKGLSKLREKIEFYQSHYDEYLRLKNQFNDPYISHQQRIDIRNKMKEITMAPLPDLVLQHVKVRLEAEVKTVKKGLFCKKKKLWVAFSVLDGEALPCDAVLNIIRGKLPVEPQRESASCIRVDIGKGERSFEREFDLLEDKRNPGGKLFVCLFTEEHQIDADAILDEDGTDKPCRMINNV